MEKNVGTFCLISASQDIYSSAINVALHCACRLYTFYDVYNGYPSHRIIAIPYVEFQTLWCHIDTLAGEVTHFEYLDYYNNERVHNVKINRRKKTNIS